MKTILCPVDFSSQAANAVRYAIALNKKLKGKIILLHAYETPVFADPAMLSNVYSESAIHAAELKKLSAFYKKIFGRRSQPRVELLLVQGLASSRVQAVAKERGVDLIVMGTTGTGAAARIFVGSNASRVVRSAPCMVLLVPPRARFSGMKKIAYATDLSDDNLIHAVKIAPFVKAFGAEVQFLYVDPDPADDERTAEGILVKVRHLKGLGHISGHILHGSSVTKSIAGFFRKQRTACLAVYTRHRSLLQELYHPSISRQIALHTSVPLLVIHANDQELQD